MFKIWDALSFISGIKGMLYSSLFLTWASWSVDDGGVFKRALYVCPSVATVLISHYSISSESLENSERLFTLSFGAELDKTKSFNCLQVALHGL